MTNKSLYAFFIILALLGASCNFATNLFSGGGGVNQPNTRKVSAGGFSGQVRPDGVVQLAWEPINGAEHYLLELQIGGQEYVPLASLAAEARSFEDDYAPGDASFTYRLSGLDSSGLLDSKQITLTTPPDRSDPLRVTPEFDMTPAQIDPNNFDPNNFDPNNFDPSQFDPNNFDPSLFAPQPIETQAVIGPQGGELSVTGSNGVVYTLSVPPGALDFDTPITLRPISNIPDLPLSGGLSAGVFIEPAALVFDVPATLRMTPPADFPAPAGPLSLAFAFEQDGREFHLYPFDIGGELALSNPHLANPGPIPAAIGPLADIAKARFGGGYGQGSGTAQDVKNISQKPPAKSANRTAQRAAVSQLGDLTPLPDIESPADLPNLPPQAKELAQTGEALRQKLGKVDDLSGMLESLEDLSIYIDAGGGKYNQGLNRQILEAFVDKAQALLKKNKGICLTQDDFLAQELVERLSNPKDNLSKALAERFKQKYGQKLLDDLTYGRKDCTFELDLKSNLTFEAEKSTLFTTAEAPKMKLLMTYSKGEIYLQGGGTMSLKMRVAGSCSFPLKQYDNLFLYVDKMYPVFEKGQLKDFSLSSYSVLGWTKAIKASGGGLECPTFVNVSGGGDYWTGLFISTRATFGNPIMTGWKITPSSPASAGGLKAHWESIKPSFSPLGVPETLMSEDTKLDLRVVSLQKKK
jgi:uncharacterized protein (DUF1778 family)